MKAIIIAGIGLFAAATIYGITDFAADKKKGTIDKLYKEEPAPVVQEENTTTAAPATEAAEKTTAVASSAVKKATARKKAKRFKVEEVREFKLSEFSRGRIVPKVVKKEVQEEPVVVEVKKEE
ncbi:MAG: hypothetical protein U0V75_11035 [Ferruginibacter sp.]